MLKTQTFHPKLDSILGSPERAVEAVKMYQELAGVEWNEALEHVVKLSAGFGDFNGVLAEKYPELLECHLRQKGFKDVSIEKIEVEETVGEKKMGCDVCGSKGWRHKADCPLTKKEDTPT